MSESPNVTVITPCYNSAQFIADTIRSVRGQSLQGWEHIVVDDGSTDDSGKIVMALLTNDSRLRYVRQTNNGVASARNSGLHHSMASSRYLLFLDADDAIHPDMLGTTVSYLDANPTVGMVHCGHVIVDECGNTISTTDDHIGGLPRRCLANNKIIELEPDTRATPFVSIYCIAGIVPSLCVIRRSVYEQTPGWDEKFGQHFEDTDLFLQIAIRSEVHFLPRKLVRYRKHPAQNTADPARFGRQEQKLYEKWSRIDGLSPAQREVISDASRFRDERLIPYLGFKAGLSHLQSGRILLAARFLGGAVKRRLNTVIRRRTAA